MLRFVCPPPLRLFDLLPGSQTCDWGEKATTNIHVSGMEMLSIVVGASEPNRPVNKRADNNWVTESDVNKLQKRCNELKVSPHGYIWQLRERIQEAEHAKEQAGQATQK